MKSKNVIEQSISMNYYIISIFYHRIKSFHHIYGIQSNSIELNIISSFSIQFIIKLSTNDRNWPIFKSEIRNSRLILDLSTCIWIRSGFWRNEMKHRVLIRWRRQNITAPSCRTVCPSAGGRCLSVYRCMPVNHLLRLNNS